MAQVPRPGNAVLARARESGRKAVQGRRLGRVWHAPVRAQPVYGVFADGRLSAPESGE